MHGGHLVFVAQHRRRSGRLLKAKDTVVEVSDRRGVFITATDTGAGKTYLASLLIAELQARSFKLDVYKPVESGCQRRAQRLSAADAEVLAAAMQDPSSAERICPYRFQPAVSPARAARLAGSRLRIADLRAVCARTDHRRFLLVEGAGGFCSPIAEDGLNADLVQSLALPVVLVVPNRLGCINHALLTVEALRRRSIQIVALVLNAVAAEDAKDPDMDNRAELSALLEETVLQTRHDPDGQANVRMVQGLADCIVKFSSLSY